MEVSHVVWDWNGTLLDDLDIVIEALNVGLVGYGVAPLDDHAYRNHYTRPIRRFYDSVFGREITDMEWEHLNKTFHEQYFARVHRAPLAADALDAIDVVSTRGWTQSLLSMTTQEQLMEIVASHRIDGRFLRIDGILGATGGLKAGYLETHVELLGVDPRSVLVIGDTPDDAAAASHVGAKAVLYDGGSHHAHELEAVGAPVAYSLMGALEVS